MTHVHSYHVWDDTAAAWLADDEQSWTLYFTDAASFTSKDLATDIAEREGADPKRVVYVLGWID